MSVANVEYLNLVRAFPLRPIRSDAQLERAVQVIDSLLDKPALTEVEEDYLEVLSDLVNRYETQEHPLDPVSDADLLRNLIEAKGVAQTDVAQATGIADSTISEVLSGKRKLSRSHIAKLATYFHVSPAAFAFEA